MLLNFRHDSIIDLSTKLCLVLSVLVVFSNYYYLYFYSFDQGVSGSPAYYSLLKVFGVALFSIAVFRSGIRKSFPVSHCLFLVFFVFSSFFFLSKRAFFDVGSDLYLNVIVCALPFLFLRLKSDVIVFLVFFEICLWLVVFQIFIDIYVFINGYSLWDNKAFVGGLGNPSSFGIFCSVILAYVLFLRKFSVFSIFSFFVILIGVIGTKSLFSVLASVLVISYFVWWKSKVMWVGLAISSGFVLAGLWQWVMSGHLGYKISSLIRLLFEGGVDGSQSITLRVEIHQFFLEKLSESFIGVMLFGYEGFYYYNADSQFLSFFGSFGVLLSLVFFVWAFIGLICSGRNDSFSRFLYVSVGLFFVMFFTNRIIDYYPMPLLFFLLVFVSLNKSKRFRL